MCNLIASARLPNLENDSHVIPAREGKTWQGANPTPAVMAASASWIQFSYAIVTPTFQMENG